MSGKKNKGKGKNRSKAQAPERASEKAMRESAPKTEIKGPKLSPATCRTDEEITEDALDDSKRIDDNATTTAGDTPEKEISPELEAILAKPPTELTVKELRILIKHKEGDKIAANAAERGKNKLAKLRTYAIRQRAWADGQTAKAEASERKASVAESKLAEYEAKIGVEALTDDEIDKVLKELVSGGRVAQIAVRQVLEPHEEDQAAETATS